MRGREGQAVQGGRAGGEDRGVQAEAEREAGVQVVGAGRQHGGEGDGSAELGRGGEERRQLGRGCGPLAGVCWTRVEQTGYFITEEMGGKGCVFDTTSVFCVKDTYPFK